MAWNTNTVNRGGGVYRWGYVHSDPPTPTERIEIYEFKGGFSPAEKLLFRELYNDKCKSLNLK